MNEDPQPLKSTTGDSKQGGKTKQSQETIDLLMARMADMNDFPAVSKNIIEINEKTGPRSLTSATQLASIITKDYSLTTKLLKMVNSALYGQFSGQITTISRAVVILGFEQVRLVATSLILFEQMQNTGQKKELKTSLLTSFLSGILARDLAEKLKMQTTEEVFICAMLHKFGKLMIMYYLPELYAEINNLIEEKELSEEKAVRQVLKCSYDSIGMSVAQAWGLPKTIISGMKKVSPAAVRKKNAGEETRIISFFANEVYEILASNMPIQEKKKAQQLLVKNFKKIIPFRAAVIEEMVDDANKKAKDFSFVLGLNNYQETVLKRLSFKAKPQKRKKTAHTPPIKELPKALPPSQLDLVNYKLSAAGKQGAGSPLDVEKQILIMNGVRDITHAQLKDDYKLDDVMNMVAETIFRGLGVSRVVICIKDTRSNVMKARYGFGQFISDILKKFKFPMEDVKDIFNRSLADKADIYVPDTDDETTSAFLPTWYSGILKDKCFALLPIVVNNDVIGLLYVDMQGKDKSVSVEKVNYLKMLRDQIVLAIRQKV